MKNDSDSPRRSCSDAAARLLADRPHFRRQLRDKLIHRKYDHSEVEATLRRFAELGYLDEEAAVRSFVEQKRRRQGWAVTRLRAELQRRGAASESVDLVLSELSEEDDERLARRELEAYLRQSGGDPERLARRLARMGFSSRVIVRLLDEARAADL